jgi:hypothetical protein
MRSNILYVENIFLDKQKYYSKFYINYYYHIGAKCWLYIDRYLLGSKTTMCDIYRGSSDQFINNHFYDNIPVSILFSEIL